MICFFAIVPPIFFLHDTSWHLHSFVIVSSLLCVVLSEVILQKLYINISTLQWWFQDKIKFILRYLPIEKKFTRQYQNANKKNATPIEKRHAWGVPGVLRETPERAFILPYMVLCARIARPPCAQKHGGSDVFFFFPLRGKSNNQTYEDNHFFYFNRIVINYMGLFFIV